MRRIIGSLLTFLSSIWVVPAHAQPERPVVIIPGILGSKLCEKDSGRVVWGNRDSLLNFAELELPPAADLATLAHASCGMIASIQILGPWRVHKYDDLVATLAQLGYVEGTNLFVFDYDWRLSNTVSAARLAERIQAWSGNDDVDLIAHSMGGIVARLYLERHGGATRVKRLITLGTPYRGSANAIRTLDKGWGFWANLLARGLDSIRRTTLSFPSVYELLPSYEKCCGWRRAGANALDYFDPLDPTIWGRFSFLPEAYNETPRKAWLAATLARARDVHTVMTQPFPAAVRRWLVATSLIDTPWQVAFDPTSGDVVEYKSWRGDGTVMDFSATDWDLQQARPSTTEHQRIFADDAVRQVIRWVLAGDREPTKGVLSGFVAKLETADGQEIEVRSVAFEVAPPVLSPGQAGTLLIGITGADELADADLSDADLSNVAAWLETGPVELTAGVPPPGTRDATVTLAFPFTAPTEPGPHSLTMRLPGVAELQDYVLVIKD